jgi:hypothetical protein
MKATDIIRNVLDLVDQVECAKQEMQSEPVIGSFAQIFAQLSQEKQGYDNSPNPHVQGIASVTTDAGGGLNGPKNPADIRADSISMYPNYQHRPE